MPTVQAQVFTFQCKYSHRLKMWTSQRVFELALIIYDDHGSTMIYVFFKVYAMLPERGETCRFCLHLH